MRNVNGGIEMVDVQGAGQVQTVNGDIDASFAASPEAATEFKTVNGRVQVALPRDLSADLRMTTLNGGLYTDFESTALASHPATREQRGNRAVYRADRFASVRVGKGGPALTFETLNGDVQVRQRR